MAISIRDIAAADSYQGNPGLGNSLDGEIKIDTAPLQQLAVYSMYENNYNQEKQEKEAQEKIKELAEIETFDWENAIPKEKDAAIAIRKELNDKAIEFARKDFKDPSVNLEWQTIRNDAKRRLTSINGRWLSYKSRLGEIAAATNVSEKERLQKKLDADVNNTTIDETLPIFQKYDVKQVDVPIPPLKNIQVAKILPNNNQEISNKNIVDFPAAASLSFGLANGLFEKQRKATTDELEAQNSNDVYEVILSAKAYTEAIPYYKNEKGELDMNKLLASGSPVAGVAQQAQKINADNAAMRERIKAGEFGTQLKVTDYPDINWQDGIDAQELILIRMLAKAPATSHTEELKHTGDANQRRNIDLDYKVAWKNAQTAASKPGRTTAEKAGDDIQSPAILFGQHIERLKDFFSKDGKNTSLTVQYKAVDEKTRLALGLQEGETVTYNKDGSYVIKPKIGEKRVGTIEQIRQGFADAVKIGLTTEGSQTEGFQRQSEEGFDTVFGTRQGKTIWDNWGTKTTQPTQATSGLPSGAVEVFSKKTGKAIGYEMPDGTKYKYQ